MTAASDERCPRCGLLKKNCELLQQSNLQKCREPLEEGECPDA